MIRAFILYLLIVGFPCGGNAEISLEDEFHELREAALDVSQALKEAQRTARQKERQLSQWRTEQEQLKAALKDKETHSSNLLSRMVQLSRAAPVSLFHSSGSPQWVRQAKLMDMVSLTMRDESSRLRHQLTQIDTLQRTVEQEERALNRSLHEVASRYAELQKVMKARQALVNQHDATETKMQRIERRRLASKARNVAALLTLIEKESGVVMVQDDVPRAGMIASEHLPRVFQLPAHGAIIKHYGEKRAGSVADAVQIRTSPRSLIYAPGEGEVVFSGPFRSYGSLLMIKHADGLMSLISGFGEPAVVIGQRVMRGEPIGYMRRDGENIVSFELRKKRKAIDPMPLIAHSVL